FGAALVTDIARARAVMQRPAALGLGLIAVWLVPLLLVALASLLVRQGTSDGLLVGLVLVATMPVANSSVGWTQQARGNLALSLGLILFSISLCPWVTPHLLQLVGLSLSPLERAYCDALVARFTGMFFIVWVILPTLLGFGCRYLQWV
ncbi:MAG: bile acid:sodium symporter, partial [Pirellulales bacterium]|nr:bile acid:sodium symporter [Pirellulales bacterium]